MQLAVCAFALGILCLQFQAALPSWGGWPALAALPLGLLWHRRGVFVRLLCLVAAFAVGFAWAAWRAEMRLADALPTDWEGRDVEVVGVVATMPQAFPQGERFEFSVETVSTAEARVPARLLISWYRGRHDDEDSELPPLRAGERWQLTLRLKRPHGNANPHGFDYEAWLLERGIRATGYVRPAGGRRLAAMVRQPGPAIERLRQIVRDRYLAQLPADRYPYAGILVALAVGDQRAIPDALWTTFNRTGVTHALSISGMHVTMLAALCGGLVGALWRRLPGLPLRCPAQRVALWAGLAAAFGYTLLAGFAVPAQRTLYMLAVAVLAMQTGRCVAAGRTLALALLTVLLIDPWAPLASGFWLSFGAVGALLYVAAGEVGGPAGWRAHLRAWGVAQWAATLASLPVLLLLFQQFSLVSPLANAFAMPLIGLLLTPLALFGAILPWWPVLQLAHTLLEFLMLGLDWCAAWPPWQAPAPPLVAVLLAGLGIAVLLLPRGVPGRLLGAFMVLPLLCWPPVRPVEGEVVFTLLDVGQGLAAVVRTRDHVLVYDPGPRYTAETDAGQRVVAPYLRALGVDRLDTLVVTHRDSDHAGGLESLRAALPIAEIRTSMALAGAAPCLAGERWTWDGVLFEFLHPPVVDFTVDGQKGPKSNAQSCVLRITAGGRRLLATSDIEAPEELALLGRYRGDLAADVLLVPHHGSRTSSTPAFIAAVGAPDVLVPVGYRNRFGHPKADVMARYAAQGARIWRTDRDGALRVELRAAGVLIGAWRGEHARYWHGR